ncbi:hypothetical protein [Asaia astilbis]|uniref:hypothetical protein n=1 Tax=Asaia astilbis TaxID=610244 RepID=UPI00046F676F|nr:hypothetical protein [Asaia astilbis]
MAFPTVPLPDVWDLPVVSGVPAVLGQSVGNAVSAAASDLLGQAVANIQISAAFKHWGIFDGADPVLTAGRVVELGHGAQYQVPTGPAEKGNFVSYNKVKAPGLTTVVMICDGSESGLALLEGFSGGITSGFQKVLGSITGAGPLQVRKSFFTTLEQVAGDTKLYDVHMPEYTYTNVNIVGYQFRRSEVDGLTMPVVEVQLQEIRNSATLSYRDTASKSPGASPVVESGQVQIQQLPNGAPDLAGIMDGITG